MCKCTLTVAVGLTIVIELAACAPKPAPVAEPPLTAIRETATASLADDPGDPGDPVGGGGVGTARSPHHRADHVVENTRRSGHGSVGMLGGEGGRRKGDLSRPQVHTVFYRVRLSLEKADNTGSRF